MEWSPQDAIKAYFQTLQLCNLHDDDLEDQGLSLGSKRGVIEPKCTEFISALAAGKKAKSIVEITAQGITPLTIALAVAAKQTQAQFLCFLVNNHNECLHINKSKQKLIDLGLEDVIHFVYTDPFQLLMHECKDIDFAVIDCKFEHHLELFKVVDLNPRGCIVVEHNIGYRKNGVSFSHVLKGKKGSVGYVILPIGEGIELTRIGPKGKNVTNKRYKRFHVTFEN